jgi:hypothetical protein
MINHKAVALLLAVSTGLLLAACQAKDQVPVESTFQSLLKLTAADAADGDVFGNGIAIDGNYAIVGAPGVDGSGTNQGAAYLLLQSQGGTDKWGQVKKLVAGDAADNDYFGLTADISGDYAVVGACYENGTGTNQGAVYIFYRNQGGTDNWGQVKKLGASDKADNDRFGFSVAIDGNTVVIGANGEDGGGTDRGAAYVFSRDEGGAGNWGQVIKLVSGDPADSSQFGYAVAIDGNIIVIGSPYETGDASGSGVAYVFSRDLGGADAWGQVVKLSSDDAEVSAAFGWSAATDGTLAVIGAVTDDGGGTNRGAVYLFSKDQGGTDAWGQVKKLTASDAHDNDYFGDSVALYGTYIVAGAYGSPGGGTERGQAYIFAKDEGGTDSWGEVQRLRASDGSNQDWFGFLVAIDGSYILVGAVGEDGAGSERGAAYLFKKI